MFGCYDYYTDPFSDLFLIFCVVNFNIQYKPLWKYWPLFEVIIQIVRKP